MSAAGWIKLHRRLLDWQWYQDTNVFRVFMHLLLTANTEDKPWEGRIIKRGQVVISPEKLGKSVGLKRQPTRTALDKLKSTNEITTQPTNKYTLVTIVNYGIYQDKPKPDNQQNNQQDNQQSTNNQPATQPTINQQLTTTKEVKKLRSKNNNKPSENYFFDEGGRIKLNQRDFEKLAKLYPNLDIQRELEQLDIELRDQPDKSWFMTMNSKLRYRNNQGATNANHQSGRRGKQDSREIDYNSDFITPEFQEQLREKYNN